MNGFTSSPYLLELQSKFRLSDLYAEAEQERLAAEATRQGRSLRRRLASSLYALAARIEGHQPRRASREGAPLAA